MACSPSVVARAAAGGRGAGGDETAEIGTMSKNGESYHSSARMWLIQGR